jgi:hypothetical protein
MTVSGGQPTSIYVNLSSVNPGTGTLRFNGQDVEVFDGTGWQRIMTNFADVSLTPTTIEILDWGRRKMQAEKDALAMSEHNVTIKDALDEVRNAEAKLQVLMTLSDPK